MSSTAIDDFNCLLTKFNVAKFSGGLLTFQGIKHKNKSYMNKNKTKTKDVKWFALLKSLKKYLYTNISDSHVYKIWY